MTADQRLYRAYVMNVSYFSGKLEAYLHYKGIPYERVETGARKMRRTFCRIPGS